MKFKDLSLNDRFQRVHYKYGVQEPVFQKTSPVIVEPYDKDYPRNSIRIDDTRLCHIGDFEEVVAAPTKPVVFSSLKHGDKFKTKASEDTWVKIDPLIRLRTGAYNCIRFYDNIVSYSGPDIVVETVD